MCRLLKEEISEHARSLGAALIGYAPAGRWEEFGDICADFHPGNIWPLTKTVIVLAVPSLLPVVETKISHLYTAQYHNTNGLLDEIAYRLAAFLNRSGNAAIPVCRDGYGPGILQKKPVAAFSHVWAGYYAGLGTIGWNHTLITREFGPRHRLVSVFTALELRGDAMISQELCSKCRLCEKICSGMAFSGNKKDRFAHMDKFRCMARKKESPYLHCGFCLKVCPVGKDRELYGNKNVRKYFGEIKNLDHWEAGVGAGIRTWKDDAVDIKERTD